MPTAARLSGSPGYSRRIRAGVANSVSETSGCPARQGGGSSNPEGDQARDQVRMQAGGGEGVHGQEPAARQCVGHRSPLGSYDDTFPSSWNSRRLASDNVGGTMTLTSAYRSPGAPAGLGCPDRAGAAADRRRTERDVHLDDAARRPDGHFGAERRLPRRDRAGPR
jgi:hypothetical protein